MTVANSSVPALGLSHRPSRPVSCPGMVNVSTRREIYAVAALLADFPRPWAFCGGWAIDLFLDRQTRAHKDIDVAVARRDQLEAQAYLTERGWRLQIAHQGTLTDWPPGEYLELPRHGIWGRHRSFEPDFLEVLLNEIEDGIFHFRRDQAIVCPLDQAFTRAPSGLSILAPEIALLYKSSSLEPDNWADLRAMLPALNAARRAWLGATLARHDPRHPWLAELDAPAQQVESA